MIFNLVSFLSFSVKSELPTENACVLEIISKNKFKNQTKFLKQYYIII